MANKYDSLKIKDLREIVKAQGIKNTSSMRKAELTAILLRLEEEQKQKKAEDEQEPKKAEGRQKPKKAEKDTGKAEKKINVSRKKAAVKETENNEEIKAQESSETETAEDAAASSEEAAYSEASDPVEISSSQAEENQEDRAKDQKQEQKSSLDSGIKGSGILEVMPDGFGFIRSANYMPGDSDIYVSPTQIRKFKLNTGDIVEGNIKIKQGNEKFSALLYITSVNGLDPSEAAKRPHFDDMVPIFPDSRIDLEMPGAAIGMRVINLISPIGKGQRGMIVSPPKTGKTTLIKQIARSIHNNYPDLNMIILLIDERPEEVTDIKEYIEGDNVEVIYSTFDEAPEHHKRVSEMVLERAKRLVEHRKDVVILLDSITRMARAYNLTVAPSGRTLSGGLDPAALYMPKKFFGAARNMREGGSLTVLATALVDTGSKMDDVVFEEFKGTGNMELVLDRRLSEKRIFPAIDIAKSGTRREDLLLSRDELSAAYVIRKTISSMRTEEASEYVLELFKRTKDNDTLLEIIKRKKSQ